MKKKKIEAFIVLTCTIVCLGCAQKVSETATEETVKVEDAERAEKTEKAEETRKVEAAEQPDAPVYHEDGTITLPVGAIAYGFYDLETDKLIDSGTTIKISGNMLQGSIHFQQNFPMERSYLLIIMIDYIQHEFYMEGQSLLSYLFKMEGESEVCLDISIPLSESEGQEFAFIVVPNPEAKSYLAEGDYDWDAMFDDRNSGIARYNLDRTISQEEREVEFPGNYESFQAEVNTMGFELVKPRDELTVCVEGKGGERLDLAVLNQAEGAEEIAYVVTGFAGWEQVPVDGEHMKYYITIPPDTSVYIPVILPEVTEPTVFQIVAFSGPDAPLDRYTWNNPTAFRVLVKP